jgi:hypothetical protein
MFILNITEHVHPEIFEELAAELVLAIRKSECFYAIFLILI